jgi:hypothetical protein
MTPVEAIKREVEIELDALARRIGSATIPRTVTIRIEFDDRTGAMRAVECREERRRSITTLTR